MIFNQELIKESELLLKLALNSKIKIVTAESCTAGLISSLIKQTPGSSQIFERGFVTYSNLAKEQNLGVKKATLEKYGAVSQETAVQMAKGAIINSVANLSLSVTGIAGPDGASKEKPIGLVYIASYNSLNEKLVIKKFNFSGSRSEVRLSAVKEAIQILINQIIDQ